MFRFSWVTTGAIALALLTTSSASAQFGRGLRIPPSVQNIMMMGGKEIKKELDLSADQQKQIDDLAGQMRSEAMEVMSGLQDLSPEEQKAEIPTLMKMITEKGKELQAKVDKVLNPKQLGRLRELSIQRREWEALEDEDVATALKLSDEQKKKLTAIHEEMEDKQQEMIKARSTGEGGGDLGALREKMMTFRKELSEKALAVLTPPQRESFDKMKGEKFDFPRGGGRPF